MNAETSTQKRKPGRKSKITEEVLAKLEAHLRAGNLVKTACAAAGIDQSTFYLWKRRGEQDRKSGDRTRYFQFIESIEVALAEGEILLVAEVRKGGARGALEILKRLHRERWGDKAASNQTHDRVGCLPLPQSGQGAIVTVNFLPPNEDQEQTPPTAWAMESREPDSAEPCFKLSTSAHLCFGTSSPPTRQ